MSKAWMFNLATTICAKLGVAPDSGEPPVVLQIAEIIEKSTAFQIREFRRAAQLAVEELGDGGARSELKRAIEEFGDI